MRNPPCVPIWVLLITGLGVGCEPEEPRTHVVSAQSDMFTAAAEHGSPPRFVGDVLWSEVPSGHAALAGDFDGDGVIDLAVTQRGPDVFRVVSGLGSGTFASKGPCHEDRLQAALGRVAQGDLDKDGRAELVYLSTLTNNNAPRRARITSVSLENERFSALVNDHDGYAGPIALGDIHGDGWLDGVVAYAGTNDEPRNRSYLQVLIGGGDKTFTKAATSEPIEGIVALDVLTCDVDGNGKNEVVLSGVTGEQKGALYVIDPLTSPLRKRSISLSIVPTKMKCADLDGNGAMDVALLDPEGGQVEIAYFAAKGAGDVDYNTLLRIEDPSYTLGANIDVADLDDDGALDIVIAGNDTRHVGPYEFGPVALVFPSDGSGRFNDPKVLQLERSDHDFGAEVLCRDFNGDGQVDLGVLTYASEGSARFAVVPGPIRGL